MTKIYKRDLDITHYNVPFLLNPFISMYTSRGCPAMCTFCLWPQTHSGHRWRLRSSDDIRDEVQYALEAFPHMKEIFFDDDTFNYRKERTIELCTKLKPLNFTWSCTSRVTTDYDTLKAMKEAGCRLLIVGYESGDPQILKNIKKGATIDMAERFTANCKKLGLVIHGDFIVGLPGETRESIRKTIDFAKKLDNETIQVSIAHPYPGTEFYDYAKKNNLISIGNIVDERGNQLPKVVYENLNEAELMDWVERFYGEYYFRPRVIWRMVRKVIFNAHDRKRLTKEAREYMALRARRKKFISEQRQQAAVSANAADDRIVVASPHPDTTLSAKTRLFAVLTIVSNVAGNSALTHGMHQLGDLGNSPLALIAALFHPWVALGVALLIVWTLTHMALLSWADLSYVMPVTAISYVVTAFAARCLSGRSRLARRAGPASC